MGTRGYRVIRFRRRYYVFYNHWDSYPEGLGTEIVAGIPVDPDAYQLWLAERRKEALEWHDAVERYLCRERADYEGNFDEDEGEDGVKSDESQKSKDGRKSDEGMESFGSQKSNESLTTTEKRPWGVATESFPNFMPSFNDLWIEWVYTIDLDHEVFTIDNGAHIHLNRIPRPDWIAALDHSCFGDRILLPSCVPEEAIADLVLQVPLPTARTRDLYESLNISTVKAKGLNSFLPTQRHGPLIRARLFDDLRRVYADILSAALLNWGSNELHFRELAYAILCLASASPNLSFVPLRQVSQQTEKCYSNLENANEERAKPEFLATLGVGCHLEGLPSGSSPESGMYWFDGALVCLAAQIDKREAIIAAVVRVVEYCRNERPNQCVNAVFMSIEHIMLAKIYPNGRVESSRLLPLFDIPFHTSRKASERYSTIFMEKLQAFDGHYTEESDNPEEPANPENPDDPNKINDPDDCQVSDNPDKPDNTDKISDPDDCEVSDNPDNPDKPDNTDKISDPDDCEVSDNPDNPDNPDKISDPDDCEVSDNPVNPDNTDKISDHDDCEVSDNPDKPDNTNKISDPDDCEVSDYPDNPGKISDPDDCEVSDNPDNPENPDNTDKISDHDDSEVSDTPKTTFMALTYFLEVSSRQNIPPSGYTEGILPTEMYRTILLHVGDLQTYHACMQVSRSFRDLCQRNTMIVDGVVVRAINTSETYGSSSDSFPTLRMKELSTGQSQDVTWSNRRSDHYDSPKRNRWLVAIGSERNRRSIVPGLVLGFDPIVATKG